MLKTGTETILIYAIVPAEDYSKVSFPKGSFAKALEIGPVEELCDLENCKGWGAMVGIALAKAGRRICPEIFRMLNPEPEPRVGPKLVE